jgi:hypothetical protein
MMVFVDYRITLNLHVWIALSLCILTKYIPSAKPETSICCVSSVMWPESSVWPVTLVMMYSAGRDAINRVSTNNTLFVGLG